MTQPIHREAWTVTETSTEGGAQTKGFWTRIGRSYLNKDGSETVLLDALPLTGRIIMREPKKTDEVLAE